MVSWTRKKPVDDALKAELQETRRQLEAVTAEVARNDEKFRQSQERELRLLQARDLTDLFHELIEGLRDSYQLEVVSVVMADPDHDIRHLLAGSGTSVESIEQLILVDSLHGLAPQYVALRNPWLGPFAACDHQLIFNGAEKLKSVAMIPLRHQDTIVGSINFGSESFDRFSGNYATDFFAHLGVIASFCVENAVNRARLLRSGFTDALTGWHNRRYLQVRLKEELARARRDQTNLVCLMLDLDHFKKVNDTYGHVAGDYVLAEMANRVESQVRASDVAARYGGEEFVVLLPDTAVKSGKLLAERIRKAVARKAVDLPSGESVDITVSVGISALQVQSDAEDLKSTGESLIAKADVALYSAKSAGRNQVVVGEVD
ncbi:MAG: sensor domain-containing diguanylate cyclase [Pseudomonadota bacterium]